MKLQHTLFLGFIACSFHLQVFANEQCRNITLEHVQTSSRITLLTFTYQEDHQERHEYTLIDVDGSASLLTILHILQTTPQASMNNAVKHFIEHQAKLLKDIYEKTIEQRLQDDLYVERILGDRIAIIDTLLRALRNGNTTHTLADITDDLFTHLESYYYQHQYEVHYHTDYNEEAQIYTSSQNLKEIPIITRHFNSNSPSNINDVIGYHFFNRCPIEVDFDNLTVHLHL